MLTTAVYAAPTFWIALALVAVFTYGAATLGLPQALRLPAFGIRTPGGVLHGWAGFLDLARHAVLPVVTLAAVGAAGIARYSRSAVADVLHESWVGTARAKGARSSRVYGRHVLRNITPQLVVLGALSLPGLVAGSVFVESVFAWPGLGKAMLVAIQARDYPVARLHKEAGEYCLGIGDILPGAERHGCLTHVGAFIKRGYFGRDS